MKLLTDEKRNTILKSLDILSDMSTCCVAHVEMAKRLIRVCCFDMNVGVGISETVLEFSNEKGKLDVHAKGDSYYISGVSRELHPDHVTEWKINNEYSPNELYIVVNEIKMFYMGKPKNAVLFTGAFCPPHIGHRGLIEQSINDGYDYSIVAVSSQEFVEKKFKKAHDDSGIIFSEQERIDMMLALTYDIPNVLVYGAERGYTYEVLRDVKRKYSIDKLSFACGSDKLCEVNRWGYHDRLLVEFGFYVLQRGDDTLEDIDKKCRSLFGRYKIVPKGPQYYDVSSTQIRKRMKDGADYKDLVTDKISDFLKKF